MGGPAGPSLFPIDPTQPNTDGPGSASRGPPAHLEQQRSAHATKFSSFKPHAPATAVPEKPTFESVAREFLDSSDDEGSQSGSEDGARGGALPEDRKRKRKDRLQKRSKKHKHGKTEKRGRHDREKKASGASQTENYNLLRRQNARGNFLSSERNSTVSKWATSLDAAHVEYDFDTRGDKENLSFGGLYRADVALYRRYGRGASQWRARGAGEDSVASRRWKKGGGLETTSLVRESETQGKRRDSRYFSGKQQLRQRDRKLRRISLQKLRAQVHGSAVEQTAATPLFLPLSVTSGAARQRSAWPSAAHESENGGDEGETGEEAVLRQTKEYNRLTREQPRNWRMWLDFVKFQDEVDHISQARRGKAEVSASSERKLAILERALSFNPENVDLNLEKMRLLEKSEDAKTLVSEWERLLSRLPAEAQLWNEFLGFRKRHFSEFSVSSVRSTYSEALISISSEHRRWKRTSTMSTGVGKEHAEKKLQDLERISVVLTVELCSFLRQAGYEEAAIACFQAAVEYSTLAPEGVEGSKKLRLFESFWESGCARVGEDSAQGWKHWAVSTGKIHSLGSSEPKADPSPQERKPSQNRASAPSPHSPTKSGQQSTIVSQPLSVDTSTSQADANAKAAADFEIAMLSMLGLESEEVPAEGGPNDVPDEPDIDSDDDEEDGEEDDDEGMDGTMEPPEDQKASGQEDLLLQLGVGAGAEEIDRNILRKWIDLEEQRMQTQWLPVRPGERGPEGSLAAGRELDMSGEVEMERIIEIDDVRECLIELQSAELKEELLRHFCQFLDIAWHSTYTHKVYLKPRCVKDKLFKEDIDSLERAITTGDRTMRHLDLPAPFWKRGLQSELWWEAAPADSTPGRCRHGRPGFCQQVSECALKTQSHVLLFHEALLGCIERSTVEEARLHARTVLNANQANFGLWHLYAQMELRQNAPSTARKVYQGAILSAQQHNQAPMGASSIARLYLSLAQLEIQTRHTHRAAHVLACMGEGTFSEPAKAKRASATKLEPVLPHARLLRARRGFQTKLDALFLAHGPESSITLDEVDVVVLQCASLLELLASDDDGLYNACTLCKRYIHSPWFMRQSESTWHKELCRWYASCLAGTSSMEPLLMAKRRKFVLKFTPSRIKDELMRCLHDHPSDLELLAALSSLYCQANGSSTQFRRKVDILADARPSLELFLVALAYEIDAVKGSEYRVRHLLEKALSSREMGEEVILWRVYISWELTRGGGAEAARKVFFRAIHVCPWSKQLWLDGLKGLGSAFSPREMGELLDIMREKELRVRTDVYEILLQAADDDELQGKASSPIDNS